MLPVSLTKSKKKERNLFFIFYPPWTFPNTSKSTITNMVLLSGTPIFTESVSFVVVACARASCKSLFPSPKTWIYASLQKWKWIRKWISQFNRSKFNRIKLLNWNDGKSKFLSLLGFVSSFSLRFPLSNLFRIQRINRE